MTGDSRSERLGRTWERVRTEPGLARNTFVTAALIVLALVVGGFILGQQRFIAPWQERYELYATFQATPGISPGQGQDVRIAGVQVGQIVDADVDDAGQARLRLSLERQFENKVYDNAHIILRPKSPLNEMYVILNPGGPPGKPLSSGSVLPIGNSERPIAIDELLGHLDDNARSMLTSLLTASDVALANAPKTLPAGLDAVRLVGNDLRPVSEQLVLRKEKLRTLVTALGEIAQAVGHDDKRLTSLGDGLQTTLGTLAGNQKNIESTVNQLPDLLAQLRNATTKVQSLAEEVDPALRNLQKATDDLPDALKALGKTSDKLDDTVDAAKGFVHEARPVVDDLKPFVSDARKGLPSLHDATKELDPVTNALIPYLPDVAAFIIQTRSITSYTDANNGILRGILNISTQTLPPLLGRPNNGIRPIPAPALDSGTTAFQKAVPTGPLGGAHSQPQDGSRAQRDRETTPGAGNRPGTGPLPGGGSGGGNGLLPFGHN
jgi:phospholipid/cholesterol/gamma-HCH transport system substrate-binding protein